VQKCIFAWIGATRAREFATSEKRLLSPVKLRAFNRKRLETLPAADDSRISSDFHKLASNQLYKLLELLFRAITRTALMWTDLDQVACFTSSIEIVDERQVFRS
jgi:hypothetical protein